MEKLELIKKYDKNLKIEKHQIITSGFHSLAIIINDELVFRFPLKSEFNIEYINEEKILIRIKPYISANIPSVKVHEIDGQLFSVHRIIKGEQYSSLTCPHPLVNLPLNKSSLAKEIAIFMKELHSIDTNLLSDVLQTRQFMVEDWVPNDKIDLLYNYLDNPKKLDDAIKIFNEETKKINPEDYVITHDDVNENNILINENGGLAGIIDFGNAVIRNHDVEFTALLKWDKELILGIIKNYEELTGRKVNLKYALAVQKIKSYGGMLDSLINGGRMSCKRWVEYIEENYEK